MGCGKIHEHYRLVEKQSAYTLWCEECGTRMHEHGSRIGFIQRIREIFDMYIGDLYINDRRVLKR